MKENCYLSRIEKTTEYHRSRYIIHKGLNYFAEFDNEDQYLFFSRTIGFYITGDFDNKKIDNNGKKNRYIASNLSIYSIDDSYFNFLGELPYGCKPIKALCNGSIVTCYYLVKDNVLYWYRPNQNNKADYKPLSIDEHKTHRSIYGLY